MNDFSVKDNVILECVAIAKGVGDVLDSSHYCEYFRSSSHQEIKNRRLSTQQFLHRCPETP